MSDKKSKLFLILGAFFMANALLAEFIGVKIFSVENTLGFESLNLTIFGVEGLGFQMTAGVLLWPVVFVMTDIINEYYGRSGVRQLSFMAVGLIIYAYIMITAAIYVAPASWWVGDNVEHGVPDMQKAFKVIFGQSTWIIIGSLVAFLIGQFVDVISFRYIRSLTGEKKIWLRATGSTLISQLIDSFVVLFVAFYIGNDWPIERVLAIGVVNYIYKYVIAIAVTPVIYAAHAFIEKYLGKEKARAMAEAVD